MVVSLRGSYKVTRTRSKRSSANSRPRFIAGYADSPRHQRRRRRPIDAYNHYYFEVPNQFVVGLPARPLERALLFPMAIVPNVWGLWNMLYLALRPHVRLPLGVHGALLVVFLIPAGVALARTLDAFTIQLRFAIPMVPIGMAIYYLAWKQRSNKHENHPCP